MAESTAPGGRFVRSEPDASARIRLYCFPYAGGGASLYYPWAMRLPAGVAVCPIHLAGREDRLSEPPATDLHRLVESLAIELGPGLRSGPFAFFGHSLGGLIAFELARRLQAEMGPSPARLFVSGARAPGTARRSPPISGLGDEEFVGALIRRYEGFPAALLGDPELMALFLPALRADFSMFDAYRFEASDRLLAPISAFGGADDREVEPEDLGGWRDRTEGEFRLRLFPGGHFFPKTSRDALIQAVKDDLGVP